MLNLENTRFRIEIKRFIESLDEPLNLNAEPGIFEVQQGDGLIRVLNTLESEGVIDSAFKIRVGLRLNATDLVVKRGEYQLSAGETVLQLLDRMDKNDVILYPITIPEGVTFSWFLTRLWEHPEVTRVLESAQDVRLLNLIQPHASPEGLFCLRRISSRRATRTLTF